jgi:hypothetical protein
VRIAGYNAELRRVRRKVSLLPRPGRDASVVRVARQVEDFALVIRNVAIEGNPWGGLEVCVRGAELIAQTRQERSKERERAQAAEDADWCCRERPRRVCEEGTKTLATGHFDALKRVVSPGAFRGERESAMGVRLAHKPIYVNLPTSVSGNREAISRGRAAGAVMTSCCTSRST